LSLCLRERTASGGWIVKPESDVDAVTLLNRHGHVPLPPYIRKGRDNPQDRLRYQTLYAKEPGAVAAPTAGLHFTQQLFETLNDRGVHVEEITLHVGLGTFRPIETDQIEEHALHAEWAELSSGTATRLQETRDRKGRIIAVGTTSARTLETA